MNLASDVHYVERGSLVPRVTRKTNFIDPHKFEHPDHFKGVMFEMLVQKASDAFIQPGYPVLAKIDGHLHALTNSVLDDNEVYSVLKWAVGRDTAQTDAMSGIASNGRYELFDPNPAMVDARGARIKYGFRVNASPIYASGGTGVQVVLRRIPNDPLHHSLIGMPEELIRKMTPKTGIVIVAGGTGTGKTTTFASVIRFILENVTPIHGNLITHEEPIEYIYDNILSAHSVLVQSQIPTHFKSFSDANREAMRRAPGLINYGELRDEDSIVSAVEAANTGHPVFGTLHANGVVDVITRMVTQFPDSVQNKSIKDIARALRFVMAQKLVPAAGGGQVACREYLPFDKKVRDVLVRADSTNIAVVVSDLLDQYGHSFAQDSDKLLADGKITAEARAELEREENE